MRYSPLAVANYFIEKGISDGDPVDQLKLQKLVYIAHGWSLAIYNSPLIDEKVQAWQYGPVIPSLYHAFKQYGNRPIDEPAATLRGLVVEVPHVEPDDTEVLNLLDRVWKQYGNYTGVQLSNITHRPDTPWSQARGGAISNDIIKKHYVELARAGRNESRPA